MRLKRHLLIQLLLILVGFTHAYCEIQPDINTILMKSTVKIAGEGAYGTAFVLGVHSDTSPEETKTVLVSAAHVFSDIKSDKPVVFFRKKTDAGYERVPHTITVRKDNKDLWVKHPDVDVGAMYITLPKDIDIQLVSSKLLATNDIISQYDIVPGTEVCALGYPFGRESDTSGFPILRSGKIASYPLIPVEQTKTFLLDLKIFAGNSGGPVYYYDPDWHKRGVVNAFKRNEVQIIMGLVSRQIVVPEKVESSVYMETTIRNHQLDIAVVVHAAYIREVLKMLD